MIRNIILVGAALALSIATAQAQNQCAEMVQLKLTVDKYHLDLNDKRPICVLLGGTFTIKIHNPPSSDIEVGVGHVHVEHKVDNNEPRVLIWGSNDDEEDPARLSVNVTLAPDKNVAVDEEFEFWIKVDGVGILDPRIKVVDNELMNNLQWQAVEETMKSWGLTVDDVTELKPPPQGE